MASIMDKIQKMWNPPDDEYDEVYEEEPVNAPANTAEDEPARRGFAFQSNNSRENRDDRVVNINSRTPAVNARQVVRAFKPLAFSADISDIADDLNNQKIVVLDFENTDKEEARRILDFLSGVAYANKGKIRRPSTYTYIITPFNVEYSGNDYINDVADGSIVF